MSYFEILKELDKSLEKQIVDIEQSDCFKKHVIADRLKSALVHVKRELRKEV